MSSHTDNSQAEQGPEVSHRTLFALERLDNYAHVIVALFFLVLSGAVLVTAGVMFSHAVTHALHGEADVAQTFIHESLEVLSTLLFAVIILELLRTIITYLQNRDTQAIMKEFLIVGIISSIRKILMVGAESSIIAKHEGTVASQEHAKEFGMRMFVQESIGVSISVVAILLMIGALIYLNRHYGGVKESADASKSS